MSRERAFDYHNAGRIKQLPLLGLYSQRLPKNREIHTIYGQEYIARAWQSSTSHSISLFRSFCSDPTEAEVAQCFLPPTPTPMPSPEKADCHMTNILSFRACRKALAQYRKHNKAIARSLFPTSSLPRLSFHLAILPTTTHQIYFRLSHASYQTVFSESTLRAIITRNAWWKGQIYRRQGRS